MTVARCMTQVLLRRISIKEEACSSVAMMLLPGPSVGVVVENARLRTSEGISRPRACLP